MHELSICGSIADIVTRHAAGRPVKIINVRVGQLRQIVPDTLVYCCGQVTEIGPAPVFACGACGGTDTEIAAGEEFLVTSLELEEQGASG